MNLQHYSLKSKRYFKWWWCYLLGDIIGGSPLTNATNVLVNKGIKTVILGGMNLPLALTTVLMKDTVSLDEIANQVLEQARMAMQEFKIVEESEEDI